MRAAVRVRGVERDREPAGVARRLREQQPALHGGERRRRERDGTRQVTYAGKPLYFYAHEGPGQVRCHNVNADGGRWWVIGPDGERRP